MVSQQQFSTHVSAIQYANAHTTEEKEERRARKREALCDAYEELSRTFNQLAQTYGTSYSVATEAIGLLQSAVDTALAQLDKAAHEDKLKTNVFLNSDPDAKEAPPAMMGPKPPAVTDVQAEKIARRMVPARGAQS